MIIPHKSPAAESPAAESPAAESPVDESPAPVVVIERLAAVVPALPSFTLRARLVFAKTPS